MHWMFVCTSYEYSDFKHLPDKCVTDNFSCFISSDFEEFIANNGIKHSPQLHTIRQRTVKQNYQYSPLGAPWRW